MDAIHCNIDNGRIRNTVRLVEAEEIEGKKTESFLDKEKLVLIFYFNVDSYERAKGIEVIYGFREHLLRAFDDSVKTLVVPVYGQPSHAEAFSMKRVDEIQIEEINRKFEEALAEMKNQKNGGYSD